MAGIKLTEKEAKDFFEKVKVAKKEEAKEEARPKLQNKTLTEKAKDTFGKVKAWAENHPVNKQTKEKGEPRERQEHRRPSRVDRYDSRGVKVETVYYTEPKERRAKPRRKDSGIGGNFAPLMPKSRGDIFTHGLGGMNPMGYVESAPKHKPKRRRSQSEKPFDYLDYMNRSPFH